MGRWVFARHTKSPTNSIPPERVFSILNDSFDDDQDSALADYIELSLQLQYNDRGRYAAGAEGFAAGNAHTPPPTHRSRLHGCSR